MAKHEHATDAKGSKYSDGTNRRKQERAPHPAALAYGVDEAAAVLGISRRTVYELIAGERLKSVKLCGRRIITRASLEELLASAVADE